MAYFHSIKFFITLGILFIALVSYIVLRLRREYLKNDPEYQKRREEAQREYRRKLLEQADMESSMGGYALTDNLDNEDNSATIVYEQEDEDGDDY